MNTSTEINNTPNKNWINPVKVLLIATLFMIFATLVLVWAYPKALYRLTYDVHTSDLYEKQEREIAPGSVLRETFRPQSSFIKTIGIHAARSTSSDSLQCILYDESGKSIARSSFCLQDETYAFTIDKRLDTSKQYVLEITAPTSNQEAITLTFGPADIGPSEHISFEASFEDSFESSYESSYEVSPEDGENQPLLYMEYIYGTYSKKLLAVWMLCFFTIGLFLGEQLLNSFIDLYR